MSSVSSHSKFHILIVEDDLLYVTIYREQLLALDTGIVIEVASNGYMALLHLAQVRYDLIILDLHMPQFDGFEFLNIVKCKPEFSELPILVISSAIDEALVSLRSFPEVSVFVKPLRPSLLQQLVRTMLPDASIRRLSNDLSLPSHFDQKRFQSFLGGNLQLQQEVATQFFDVVPDQIANIYISLKKYEYSSLHEWCHKLAGTASLLGASILAERIASLRGALNESHHPAIEHAVGMVVKELRDLAVTLYNYSFDSHQTNRE